MINEPVTVEFTLTKSEFLRAVRVASSRSWVIRLYAVVAVVGIIEALLDPYNVVFAIAMVVVLWWFVDGGARRRWRKRPHLHAPRRVTVDDTGVRETNQLGEAFATWDAIRAVRHLKGAYYFWVSRNCVVELPDRVVAPEDRERLVPLVSRTPLASTA